MPERILAQPARASPRLPSRCHHAGARMSNEIFMERTVAGLKPVDDQGVGVLRKIKVGEVIQCELNKPRNLAHHRKFWALLNVFWAASGDWSSPYMVLIELKVRLGHVQAVLIRETGEIVHVPKSISFAQMDQTQFDEFYEKAVIELCKMGGGIEPAALREEVLVELSRA
jgi:hypothetical protein